jgi:putative ATP-binding cassette transporter
VRIKRRVLPLLLALARPYWSSEDRWRARGLLALLLCLMLANTSLLVFLNEQTGEFTSALAAQDSARFWTSLYKTVGIMAAAAPIYVSYYYVRDRLINAWRRWLTQNYVTTYFTNTAFYKLAYNADIDNPDQRIAEDINTFTTRAIFYSLMAIDTVLTILAFSGVLWSISRTLVFVLVAYAATGTLIAIFFFGRKLVSLNMLQLRREADFRFGLVRVRENAESIAFYRGEEPEEINIKERFSDVYENYNRIIKWQRFLNLFQHVYSSISLIIPGLIIAPQVLSGELEVGRVVQATGAFAAIFSALTIIVSNFDTLSRFAAGISRLDRFTKSLEVSATESPQAREVIETVEDDCLAIDHLTLKTPDYRRTLVADLSLEIKPGEGVLIVGASGGGKSSLLRALGGLWDSGTGTITRPPLARMLFLPQRPYMIIGSLRSQLTYPAAQRNLTDDEVRDILKRVNLPDLEERCGGLEVEADWGKILSLGEQQRVAFARVLIFKPGYVILDEATSALDSQNEDALYQQLQEAGTTLVSVSHHLNLIKYHKQVLELEGDGSWHLSAADTASSNGQPRTNGRKRRRAKPGKDSPVGKRKRPRRSR